MQGILIFGGTTEGKRLAEYFEEIGVECIMSVATEYGRKVLPEHLQYCRVISGRMYPEEMLAFVRKHRIRLLIDATHPYAVEVTKNILQVCKSENIPYIRVSRPQTPRRNL